VVLVQIIRVQNDIKKSTVDREKVSDLPEGLRKKMANLLANSEFSGNAKVKTINIGERAEDAILELPETNVTLDFFNETLRKEFIETVELFWWYRQPHWHSSRSGAIGAPVHCAHCGSSYVCPGPTRGFCTNSGCPSHEKWRQIIGPSYEIPENPDAKRIEQEMKNFKSNPEIKKFFKKLGKDIEQLEKKGGYKEIP
jgi:hypothetical protein